MVKYKENIIAHVLYETILVAIFETWCKNVLYQTFVFTDGLAANVYTCEICHSMRTSPSSMRKHYFDHHKVLITTHILMSIVICISLETKKYIHIRLIYSTRDSEVLCTFCI